MSKLDELEAYLGGLSPIELCLQYWLMVGEDAYDGIMLADALRRTNSESKPDMGDYILMLALQEVLPRIYSSWGQKVDNRDLIEDTLVALTHRLAAYRLGGSKRPEQMHISGVGRSYSATHCYWMMHDLTGIQMDNIELWINMAVLDGATGGQLIHKEFEELCYLCGLSTPGNVARWRKGKHYVALCDLVARQPAQVIERLGIEDIISSR